MLFTGVLQPHHEEAEGGWRHSRQDQLLRLSSSWCLCWRRVEAAAGSSSWCLCPAVYGGSCSDVGSVADWGNSQG